MIFFARNARSISYGDAIVGHFRCLRAVSLEFATFPAGSAEPTLCNILYPYFLRSSRIGDGAVAANGLQLCQFPEGDKA